MANQSNQAPMLDNMVEFMRCILKQWESTTVWGTRNVGEVIGSGHEAHIERHTSVKMPMSYYTMQHGNGVMTPNLNVLKQWIEENCRAMGKPMPHVDSQGFMYIKDYNALGVVIDVVKDENILGTKYRFQASNTLTAEMVVLGELNQDITDSMNFLQSTAEQFSISCPDNGLMIDVMEITLTGNYQSRLGLNVKLWIG
jgi:hypothetical protein